MVVKRALTPKDNFRHLVDYYAIGKGFAAQNAGLTSVRIAAEEPDTI